MKKEKYKYYTPEIEEFHVGFEYEYKSEFDDKFYNTLVEEGNVLKLTVSSTYRVKYLDQEDIESSGFELTNDFKNSYHLPAEIHKLKHLILIKDKYKRIKIVSPNYIRDGSGRYDGYITKFLGIIKNKSKLKDVLEMLNIK